MVESQPSKLLVAGSIPVSRSNLRSRLAIARELRLAGHREQDWLPNLEQADVSAVARVEKVARAKADVAQLAERVLGKDEVTSSILVIGSNLRSLSASHGKGRLAGHDDLSTLARRATWKGQRADELDERKNDAGSFRE